MRPCLRFTVSSSSHPFISTFEVFSLVHLKQPVDSALMSLFLILGFFKTQARTKCDFDKKPADGELACQTGSCIEGLICQSLFTGAPASVAEFSFTDKWDFYDCSSIKVPQSSKLRWLTASNPTTVSLVAGYNVNVRSKYHCPIDWCRAKYRHKVSPSAAGNGARCTPAECVSNILETCAKSPRPSLFFMLTRHRIHPGPPEIRVTAGDETVGCMGSCYARLDGSPANSSNCCSGSFSTPDMCTASGVKYYTYYSD